jgi:hypothetical protein
MMAAPIGGREKQIPHTARDKFQVKGASGFGMTKPQGCADLPAAGRLRPVLQEAGKSVRRFLKRPSSPQDKLKRTDAA